MKAFQDEYQEIAKEAIAGGAMRFISAGFKNLGRAASKGSFKPLAGASAKEGRLGAIDKIKGYYQKGADKGGWWGGVKQVAKSPVGQTAAAVGTVAAPTAFLASR